MSGPGGHQLWRAPFKQDVEGTGAADVLTLSTGKRGSGGGARCPEAMASLLDMAEGKRPQRGYGWSPNDLPELLGPSMDATAGGRVPPHGALLRPLHFFTSSVRPPSFPGLASSTVPSAMPSTGKPRWPAAQNRTPR